MEGWTFVVKYLVLDGFFSPFRPVKCESSKDDGLGQSLTLCPFTVHFANLSANFVSFTDFCMESLHEKVYLAKDDALGQTLTLSSSYVSVPKG